MGKARQHAALVVLLAVVLVLPACTGSGKHKISSSPTASSSAGVDIGQGVRLKSGQVPTGAKAAVSNVALPVQGDFTVLSKTYTLTPTGTLSSATTVTMPLGTPLASNQHAMGATEETRAGPWTFVPVTPSADGKSVSFSTSHFSIWGILGFLGSAVLKSFEALFSATIADGIRSSGAAQPTCANEAQARKEGFSIASTTSDTVFWCFGEANGGRVLTIVNNRRYPLELNYSHVDYKVLTEDALSVAEFASVSRLISGGASILAPGGSITYQVIAPVGYIGLVESQFDGVGEAFYQLQVGVETAISLLMKFGLVKSEASSAKTLELMDKALSDTHCIGSIESGDIYHVIPDCLGAAGVLDLLGAAAGIITVLATASALINFFHSAFTAGWDLVTGHDKYTIQISHSAIPLQTVLTAPESTWQAQSYVGTSYSGAIWKSDKYVGSNCVAYAQGAPVINYLNSHPCKEVDRSIATTTVNGRPVEIVHSQVAFGGNGNNTDPINVPSYGYAKGFCDLVRQDGTGNIIDLLQTGIRFAGSSASVASPDAFLSQFQDSVCVISDAWYLDGKTSLNDPDLEKMEMATLIGYLIR